MTPTTSNGNQLLPQQTPQLVSYRKRKYQNSATSDNDFSDDESSPKTGSPPVDDDKRAHHNELERRRRDHIKDHFMNLKSSIPLLEGEKSSRALILKRAADYICMLQNQVKEYKAEVEDLKRRNENLSQQNNGINLKPFITSLHLQSTQQPVISFPQHNIPNGLSLSPTTSNYGSNLSLANGLSDAQVLSHQSNSSQCTLNTLVSTLQNPNLLANLLLQNPSFVGQSSAFEPLTPPSSASLNPELLNLALRERQFAAAVATSP